MSILGAIILLALYRMMVRRRVYLQWGRPVR